MSKSTHLTYELEEKIKTKLKEAKRQSLKKRLKRNKDIINTHTLIFI